MLCTHQTAILTLVRLTDFKRTHALSFAPFPELVDSASAGTRSVAAHKAAIKAMIAAELYEEAQNMSMDLVRIGLRGLRYYQTYDWFILRTIVTLGYLGFMAFSANHVLQRHVFPLSDAEAKVNSLLRPLRHRSCI